MPAPYSHGNNAASRRAWGFGCCGFCEQQGKVKEALDAYQAAMDANDKAIRLKPDEVAYTATRDHILARMENIRQAGYAPQ